ncbi:hypothetical protein ACTMTF_18500 [Nonomuraea sp. ZG12]|uniref:hypothetical protein n=1 Tax=Nonomuraea sp. ZG12 TaxID=3452207 RepID=UPI003F8B5B0D
MLTVLDQGSVLLVDEKEENLERGYLRGRYGGVPRVTAREIVREIVLGHDARSRASLTQRSTG